MSGSLKRQLYAVLLVGSLMIGGAVWRLVLSIYSGGAETITLGTAGGQGVGLAAMSWALTTVFVFTLGVIVLRTIS